MLRALLISRGSRFLESANPPVGIIRREFTVAAYRAIPGVRTPGPNTPGENGGTNVWELTTYGAYCPQRNANSNANANPRLSLSLSVSRAERASRERVKPARAIRAPIVHASLYTISRIARLHMHKFNRILIFLWAWSARAMPKARRLGIFAGRKTHPAPASPTPPRASGARVLTLESVLFTCHNFCGAHHFFYFLFFLTDRSVGNTWKIISNA